jgi:hypothetical protein
VAFPPKPPYPQLDAGERTVAELASVGETAVLTDRRLIVASRAGESSTALAHIATLRVRYEQLPRAILGGLVLAAIAALLLAIATPVRTFLLNQSVAMENSARQEKERPEAEGSSVSGMLARIAGSLASAARILSPFGWVLALLAAVNLVRGIVGRTVVTVFAGGGELEMVRFGRNRRIEEFVKEVGRNLPGPAAR